MTRLTDLLDTIEGKVDLREVEEEWCELKQAVEFYLGSSFLVDIDNIPKEPVPMGTNRGSENIMFSRLEEVLKK